MAKYTGSPIVSKAEADAQYEAYKARVEAVRKATEYNSPYEAQYQTYLKSKTPIQQGRINALLKVKRSYSGVVLTRRQFIDGCASKGLNARYDHIYGKGGGYDCYLLDNYEITRTEAEYLNAIRGG